MASQRRTAGRGRVAGHSPARSRRASSRAQRPFIQRNRGAIVVAIGAVVVGALIVIAALQASDTSETASSAASQPADPALVAAITTLPQSLFDSIGRGIASNPPERISPAGAGPASGPQAAPELLFVGGEFCPFCAAERWPLIIALSRFGTFQDLSVTRSAADDAYPNTATLTFYGSSYESPYLSFEAVELYGNQRSGNGYVPLEELTGEQSAIYERYNPGGGIPFLYIDGEFILQGANFSPDLLADLDWSQIAAEIQEEDSPVARAVIGSANILTAAICQTTDGQPGEVCQSEGVLQAADMLP